MMEIVVPRAVVRYHHDEEEGGRRPKSFWRALLFFGVFVQASKNPREKKMEMLKV